MITPNTDLHQTAYTVSVDASHSTITTGISPHDRALTCRTLASPLATPLSFRRPGHLFPLRARPGGVRERKGHTEAAVEFCRLAGKRPVGVICELVGEGEAVEGRPEVSGSGMLRRDGCLAFGRTWGIKVCTIEALCEYLERVEGDGDWTGVAVGNGMNGRA
jgi:3,4-dihydroxy 2-butanone 4-phosphate synthase